MPRKKVVDAPTLQPEGVHPGAVLGGIAILGLVVVVIAILVGRADGGAIDVSRAIQNSNAAAEKAYSGEGEAPQPVTNPYSNQPNGGLVGKGAEGVEENTTPPEPVVEETGTSTEAADESVTEEETPVEPSSETVPEETASNEEGA